MNLSFKILGLLSITLLTAAELKSSRLQAQDRPQPIDAKVLQAKSDDETVKKASLLIAFKSTENLLQEGFKLDKEAFLEGVKKAFEKADLGITEDEAQQCLMAYQQHHEETQNKKLAAAGDDNKKEGEAFLAKNAEKEGVKKLPSGVQYEVLKTGTGETPKATDSATVHYHGMLPDGTVFDSSVKKGKPATFPVNGVVAGFSEALQNMKVGDKWRVVIPSDLAYGPRGPGAIGPNRTLIFEIELLSIGTNRP